MLKQFILFCIFSSLVNPDLFSQKVTSRQTYFKQLLKDIDSIEVACIQNNDTTKYIVTKHDEIKTFIEVITGHQDIPKSKLFRKRGYLIYYQRQATKLKVDVLDTGVKYNYKKEIIISLLTYQADMLFMENCSPEGFNIKE